MQDRVAQQILKTEFERRSSRNNAYSLRAFAKSLGISHTVLSLVLSGKRKASKNVVHAIVKNIDLQAKQKTALHSKDKQEHVLTLAEFEGISDWVDYAIISLCEEHRMTLATLAKRLDVNISRLNLAVERLVALGLLEQNGNYLKAAKSEIRVPVGKSTAAGREFNRRLLRKAEDSMDLLPFAMRSLTNIIFSMSADDVPFAIERIDEFRRTLSKELEIRNSSNKDVYALCVQLFPLTNVEKTEDKHETTKH